jgi:cytosine/creatinine deaminase
MDRRAIDSLSSRAHPNLDLVIRQVRPAAGEPVDVGVAGGLITAIGPHLQGSSVQEVQGQGRVIIPGLVEAHLHLDKALLADRQPNDSGTLAEALKITAEQKRTFTPEDVRMRAERALRMVVRRGTTAIRAETEFDPVVGLMGVVELLHLKERYSSLVDLQVVAFPQEGIHQAPGTEDLFWQAMELGADVVGGIPYNDWSAEKHIDLCFEIARVYDKPISFHQDFRDEADQLSIEYVAHKNIAAGWQGRVTVGHATALSALPPERLADILESLRTAGITVVTLPATDLYLGARGDTFNVRRALAPVRALIGAGINTAVSSNNIRNAFTPFGNGDLLQSALLLIPAAHLGGSELARLIDLVTTNPARALGFGATYGIGVGKVADLVVLDTTRIQDVVIDMPERLWVIKNGLITVQNSLATDFLVAPHPHRRPARPTPSERRFVPADPGHGHETRA